MSEINYSVVVKGLWVWRSNRGHSFFFLLPIVPPKQNGKGVEKWIEKQNFYF